MKNIDTLEIQNAVKDAFIKIGVTLDDGVLCRLKGCNAANAVERFALDALIENAETARRTDSPVCQDTGLAVVFLDVGQDVSLTGKYVEDAINDGVREAYKYFRKSVVSPLLRENTGDNTPAVIHTRIVKGSTVTVTSLMKGFGSENMSRLFMLTPADGIDAVIDKVVETIRAAGSCPCPPVIVGVGIGGTMEKAALLSKHALTRDVNSQNDDAYLSNLEKTILDKLNALNIGVEGFSGNVTALAVLIETSPTHIAGLPVAVTVQCHCSRHTTTVIGA